MVVIFAAATVLINPPGATPELTLGQVWAALELKRRYVVSRSLILSLSGSLFSKTVLESKVYSYSDLNSKPQLFLPVIDTCEVLEDDGESILREVKFKDGMFILISHLRGHHTKNKTGGGVGMAPTIGPKVRERITHIAPITVCFPFS